VRPYFTATLIAMSLTASAQAGVLYSTGFDPAPASPAFTINAIHNQNSWVSVDLVGVNTTAFRVVNAANESVPAASTPQVVRSVSPTGAADIRYAYIALENQYNNRPVGENVVVSSVKVYRPSSQTSASSAHGVQIVSLPAQGGSAINMATWYVLPANGEVFFASQSILDVATGLTIPTDTWTTVNLLADDNTGAAAVEINGQVFAQTGAYNPATSPSFGDADLINFSGADNVTVSTLYFDDYTVSTQTAIPEPAALTLLGATSVLVLRRKRVQ
jgi:hypothetical protein